MTYIGISQDTESEKAGREAAGDAKNQIIGKDSVSWVLAFCGGRHEPDKVLNGIRSELGNVDIYGGSAVGIITNSSLGYTGYECGLAVFTDPFPVPEVIVIDSMKAGEYEAGRNLGIGLEKVTAEDDTVLIFYDNTRSAPPPVLYTGSQLVDGLYAGLGGKILHIIGAGMVGDFTFSPSFICSGSRTMKHSVIAVVLPKTLTPHTTIMHGCTPVSSFLEITRIEGPVLYELDGQPATDVFSDMLGIDQASLDDSNIPFLVTLGRKYGDTYSPYNERAYVNRLIINVNPDEGSVTLFEADFQLGEKVQIMSRDNRMMVESVEKQTIELLETIDMGKSEFALYIDCAGRASGFSGSEVEEAGIVRKIIGDSMPLLGFYSGVEIAPLLGRSRPLDWTGVLTVFTNEKD
ncbi:MAG: FIST C-terminal domain-containing protein [Candidatus Aegiribacteria sp.]|nr:FIST C-terminal domain-containing protein [Candidatus Aegiribacteria sp.]